MTVATSSSTEQRSARIYVDQNVLSHIARTAGDWRENPYARLLLKDFAGRAEVWISPTHVIEILLCPDVDLRTRMANVALRLADGQRMSRDIGTLLVEGFLAFVESACPGGIRSREYVEHYSRDLQHTFLAALALMALGYAPNASVVSHVTRLKLESRWLRAEAGVDPKAWVDTVKRCAKELALTPDEPRPELTSKSEVDLVREIAELEDRARRIDQKDREGVLRERDDIVRAYAISDVLQAFGTTFNALSGDLLFTFAFDVLARDWPAVMTKLKCRPLPSPGAFGNISFVLEELARSMWRPANGIVGPALVAQEVVIRDYLDRLNEKEKDRKKRLTEAEGKSPTDSLTFDADHAAIALGQMDVFVTRDEILLNSTKSTAKKLREMLKWECLTVFSPDEMAKAIRDHRTE